MRRICLAALICLGLAATVWVLVAQQKPPQDQYWTKERIQQCLKTVDKLRAQGVVSEQHYQKKRAMLQQRLAGTFKSTALATQETGEVNFIQNAGFEEINRNSAPNRSRWLWWSGWDWGGDYENFWATGENKRSGEYAAGIRCTGRTGRIGIFTPPLPMLPGTTELVFTIWAKGEGDNMLFLNFESGASGTLRQKIGPEWTEVTLKGEPEQGAKEFGLYIYVVGSGTIYLDDAKLVPVGANLED